MLKSLNLVHVIKSSLVLHTCTCITYMHMYYIHIHVGNTCITVFLTSNTWSEVIELLSFTSNYKNNRTYMEVCIFWDTVFESGGCELTNYGVVITKADVRLIPIHTEIHITF